MTPITANHCPGAAIFFFESIGIDNKIYRILHCGDFRVNMEILNHPILRPFSLTHSKNNLLQLIDKVYLDTTYMSPKHNLPKQELVCEIMANLFQDLIQQEINKDEQKKTTSNLFSNWFGNFTQSRITDFCTTSSTSKNGLTRPIRKKKFLIVIGTYIIGKEKLAISILKRLNNCLIYLLSIGSRKDKFEIFKTYKNDYLNLVMTIEKEFGNINDTNDSDCMIHLVPMTLVSNNEELSKYFNHNKYYQFFERCIGLCPTGWSYSKIANTKKPNQQQQQKEEIENDETGSGGGGGTDDLLISQLEQTITMMENQPSFNYINDILSQIPTTTPNSTKRKTKTNTKTKTKTKTKTDPDLYRLYSVPYSEHSSFRELAYFIIFFQIKQTIPTVNYENEFQLIKMNRIIQNWEKIRQIILKSDSNGSGGVDDDNNNIPDDLLQRIQRLSLNDF